jgi:2-polyprenyl-3-methyl-5-hydroxy-6-metoxy-1,4-benzoquinol methylase
MARFGHRVDGVDVSEAAIQACRSEATDLDDYAISSLAEWRPPCLYYVVFTVDVLFHVMEDTEFEGSVRNLASLVRLGGQLILSDHDAEVDRTWASYQHTRGLPRYRELLHALGFGADMFVPYGFRGTPVG